MRGPKLSVLLSIAAIALIAAGFMLGFVPVSASGVSCGSAFNSGDQLFGSDECDALRTASRPWAVAAFVLGIGVFAMAAHASGAEDDAARTANVAATEANRPRPDGDGNAV